MINTNLQPIENAIIRTILYADVFQFPLTLDEIHHYLIAPAPYPKQAIQEALHSSAFLDAKLIRKAGFYTLVDKSEYIDERLKSIQAVELQLQYARQYGSWFANLPYVRMVTLTGALAAQNPASTDDDYDYLIIVEPGRVWFTRACAIILVRVARLFGIALCPNYILSTQDLLQQRQNIFMARELAQMQPIFGMSWYFAMRENNAWTKEYFPNATSPLHDNIEYQPSRFFKFIKNGLERVFSGQIGKWLESWEFERKRKRFEPAAQQPEAHAIVAENQIKGHFQDHGSIILHAYYDRLEEYDLTPQTDDYPQAGD